jgi:hypothetical protein
MPAAGPLRSLNAYLKEPLRGTSDAAEPRMNTTYPTHPSTPERKPEEVPTPAPKPEEPLPDVPVPNVPEPEPHRYPIHPEIPTQPIHAAGESHDTIRQASATAEPG